MDRKTKWSGVAVAALIAGAANGGDRGQFQITPYLGNARVRVDGAHLEFGDSQTYDQWIAGISAAYRAPFGLVVEIGTAATGEPMFGWATGGEVRETYGAVGYDFELGRGWYLAPKLGLTSWASRAGNSRTSSTAPANCGIRSMAKTPTSRLPRPKLQSPRRDRYFHQAR